MLYNKTTKEVWELSLYHLSKRDRLLLTMRYDPPLMNCVRTPRGCYITLLNKSPTQIQKDALIASISVRGFSDAFCNIFKLAWKNNIDIIHLDEDHDVETCCLLFEK